MREHSPMDEDAAAWLATAAAAGAPPVTSLTPEQARAVHVAGSAWLSGPGEQVQDVRDMLVAGVPVRCYRPADIGGDGVVVYVHGGGWVLGTLDTYDSLCRALTNRTKATVISVDYTPAPDARHPHQIHEVEAVLTELTRAGGAVALAGDSAGAHTAASVAARTAGNDIDLRALSMIYPVVAPFADTASRRDFATGFLLTAEAMQWFGHHYVPLDGTDAGVPLDLRDVDLAAFPPTQIMVAELDLLIDEALEFAELLQVGGGGGPTWTFGGQLHGFVRALAQVSQAFDALTGVGAFLSGHLHPANPVVLPRRYPDYV